jgi:hypothetical protein
MNRGQELAYPLKKALLKMPTGLWKQPKQHRRLSVCIDVIALGQGSDQLSGLSSRGGGRCRCWCSDFGLLPLCHAAHRLRHGSTTATRSNTHSHNSLPGLKTKGNEIEPFTPFYSHAIGAIFKSLNALNVKLTLL